MKNKKGFSITEVVIAMVIVTVVSISALSVVLGSVNTKAAAVSRTKAQDFAANALECYKANPTDFITYLYRVYDDLSMTGNDASGVTVYRYTGTDWEAEMRVSANEFNITVTDDDGDEIISLTYSRKTDTTPVTPTPDEGAETEGIT